MIGVELVRPGTGTPGEPGARAGERRAGGDASGAGCWSARAACTATCCASRPPLTLTADEAAEGLALLTASIEIDGECTPR